MSMVFTAGCSNLLCKAFCNFLQRSDLKSVFCSVIDKSITAGSESGYSINIKICLELLVLVLNTN